MQTPDHQALQGRKVLDVGANDGSFTVVAMIAGARKVPAIDKDWSTWPKNLDYASRPWGLRPEILGGDFLGHAFGGRIHSYDFECTLSGPQNRYTAENPYRQFFKFTKRA